MTLKKRPSHRVFTVEDIDDENSWWTNIGVAFTHEDKQGMNILLRALPTDGRLVLRKYSETPADRDAELAEVKASVKKTAQQASTQNG